MSKTITAPKWASAEQLSEMKQKSVAVIDKVKETSGPALMRVVDGIGSGSQKRMARANDLMSGNVGTLLQGLDGKSPAAESLLELRSAMDELNPHSLHNKWWFSWMPAPIKRKAVSNFIHKYQPMQTHVNGIFDGLRAGKDRLLEINLELEQQYYEIEAAQKEIQADIHVTELVIQDVEQLIADVDDTDLQEKQKLAQMMNKAARRVRDLRTMEQASAQLFISIDQTIATNEPLSEQIDSALLVGPMIMNNALRIQSALAQQKSISNAVRQAQEGMSDMMAQNARAVNESADEIGDLYNNPVLALDKLEEGHAQLMQAVDKANQTMAESTIKARESSARLAEMTSALNPTVEALKETRLNNAPKPAEKEVQGEVVKDDENA